MKALLEGGDLFFLYIFGSYSQLLGQPAPLEHLGENILWTPSISNN